MQSSELSFYVGTYTKFGNSEGIYHGTLNVESGAVKMLGLSGRAVNPSFVALHPSRPLLYSVCEWNGGGAVAAFAIEEGGGLRELNIASTRHAGNCHVWVDAAGKNVLAASYGSGTIASLPILSDGSLGEPSCVIQHTGSGPDAKRQEKAHAHAVYHVGAFVYACDLGTDDVFIYRYDPVAGTLSPHEPRSARVPAGGGPRHMAFAPGLAFVNSEMTSAITSFIHDRENGTMLPVETVSTLPADYATPEKSATAEIHCHPHRPFVYVSNRGHDSIAVFSFGKDGRMSPVEFANAHVKTPRGFGISPCGRWLLAAGQDSNDLALHAVDESTGRLEFRGVVGQVGSGVNVEFARM
jgi:6-phosphogluconolactonase